jgi:hypothetical protein
MIQVTIHVEELSILEKSMMARRALLIVAMVALLGGCGKSTPSTPAELGLVHLGKGRYEQAIAACDEAIRLNPRDDNAYLVRGRAYQFRNEKGDADRAIADFSESIRIAPKQTEAYYSRAIAYRDQGDAEKSLADEARARQLDASIGDTYSHLPETTQPVGTVSLEKPAGETGNPTATEAAESPADDVLTETLRQRRERGLDAEERESGSTAVGTGGTPRNRTRDPLGLDVQRSRRRADGETTDNRQNYNRNQPNATSKRRPDNDSKSWAMPLDSYDARQERGGEGMRREGPRGGINSRWNEPTGPVAPGRSRGGRLSDLPRLPSPTQSPFPQLAPRPTGFVEEPVQSPFNGQPRQTYTNPYAAPTVHPPGAYHDDYNP